MARGAATYARPKWRRPPTLGYPAALDAVGNVAAPLLGGFSLASTVVVADDAANFRWPGWALLALTTAAVLLLNAVQCGFHARRYLWSADDANNWMPDLKDHAGWEEHLQQQQHEDYDSWRQWVKWTIRLYNAGIVALLAGLALALPPPHGDGLQQTLRWVAFAIAVTVALVEFAWTVKATWRGQP
ncbi:MULTISPECIES: hypothetical protein [unclassified Geodermatophilus]